MDLDDGRVRWLLGVAAALVVVSFVFSRAFGVPFVTVLKPFAGLVVVGMVLGWGAYNVVEFNPYEY